ncbi:MAG TPA: sigma-54 dependent transcriptional regulator [Chthoniobacterales bacterium]
MARVLIIDDDEAFREALAETLQDLGHEVVQASSAEHAFELAGQVDLIFLDQKMPGLSGIDFLRTARPEVPVVVLTAYASSANTIKAIKLGAFDHLTKPIGRSDLIDVLARVLTRPSVHPSAVEPDLGEGLIGFCPRMREVQKKIGVAASGDVTVLVQGETGTGKELVATAIHRFSDRGSRPFVAVNGAGIPRELLESELFGHVRGAFTGALADRPGRFREADGGTLFLDEIGDMGLEMQAKVLRVLQDKVVAPLGGNSSRRVDVRIVAATHQNLAQKVEQGGFRKDLFFRINALTIELPPLRERGADILVLAEHFLRRCGRAGQVFSAGAARKLLEHLWPGNVRELENAVRSASLAVRGLVIGEEDLPLQEPADFPGGLPAGSGLDFHAAVRRLEKQLLQRALARSQGNRAEAARLLNIHRQLLYAKLREHDLEEDQGG